VLSLGNIEDLAKMYANWHGAAPSIGPMLKFRGIAQTATGAK
jgi:Zn-dependent oligopeptidase